MDPNFIKGGVVCIMRHATREYINEPSRDRLSQEGILEAQVMAKEIERVMGKPDLILTSQANRAIETGFYIGDHFREVKIMHQSFLGNAKGEAACLDEALSNAMRWIRSSMHTVYVTHDTLQRKLFEAIVQARPVARAHFNARILSGFHTLDFRDDPPRYLSFDAQDYIARHDLVPAV